MARVELLTAERAPLLARPYYEGGDPGPIAAALANVPELLEVTLPLLGRVYGPTSVDPRLKEIVVLRVSVRAGCRYCVATHTVAAWDAGVTEAETAALHGSGQGLGEREAALVEWCDEIARCGDAVGDEAIAQLHAHFAEHEIVELTLLAGATVMLNRFCTALQLEPSPATVERLASAGAYP